MSRKLIKLVIHYVVAHFLTAYSFISSHSLGGPNGKVLEWQEEWKQNKLLG